MPQKVWILESSSPPFNKVLIKADFILGWLPLQTFSSQCNDAHSLAPFLSFSFTAPVPDLLLQDYEPNRLLATEAMYHKPMGEPNSAGSGLGFSCSMPEAVIR